MGYGRGGVGVQANCIQVRGALLIPHLCTNKRNPSHMNINSYVVFVLIFRYSGGKSEEIMGDMDCLKDSKV